MRLPQVQVAFRPHTLLAQSLPRCRCRRARSPGTRRRRSRRRSRCRSRCRRCRSAPGRRRPSRRRSRSRRRRRRPGRRRSARSTATGRRSRRRSRCRSARRRRSSARGSSRRCRHRSDTARRSCRPAGRCRRSSRRPRNRSAGSSRRPSRSRGSSRRRSRGRSRCRSRRRRVQVGAWQTPSRQTPLGQVEPSTHAGVEVGEDRVVLSVARHLDARQRQAEELRQREALQRAREVGQEASDHDRQERLQRGLADAERIVAAATIVTSAARGRRQREADAARLERELEADPRVDREREVHHLRRQADVLHELDLICAMPHARRARPPGRGRRSGPARSSARCGSRSASPGGHRPNGGNSAASSPAVSGIGPVPRSISVSVLRSRPLSIWPAAAG